MSAKRRVLFVDDEVAILEAMACTFRRRYDVVVAASASAALAALARDPAIEVIVSDLRMPVMDGVTLLGRVSAEHPAVACILLTGTDPSDGPGAPIIRTLAKPCSRAELQGAIDAAVASPAAPVCC